MWQPNAEGSKRLPGAHELDIQPYTRIKRSKRAIVVDMEKVAIFVATEEYVLNSKAPRTAQACTDTSLPSGFEVYQKLQIPSRDRIEIYEEPNNTYTLQGGGENSLALIMRCNSLRLWHRALHFAGMLGTLYIVNGKPVDDNSPLMVSQARRRSALRSLPTGSQAETRAEQSRKVWLLDWKDHGSRCVREDWVLKSKGPSTRRQSMC